MINQSIAVIGGGITGLAAAHRIALENQPVRLFEASPRLGGSVETLRTPEGWLIETGPNTVLAKSRELAALINQIGLTQERQPPNSKAKKRYLVRGGKLHALPSSPFSAFTTKIISWQLKRRIIRDYLFARPRHRTEDVPLAQLAREHYGDEFVDYALNPMVAGIYAGNPQKLSARIAMPFIWEAERSHGSIVRGQLAQAKVRRKSGAPKSYLLSFKDGLGALPAALAAQLPRSAIETNAQVISIARVAAPASDKPRWQIRWSRNGTTYSEVFSRIILALPASALARLQIAPMPVASPRQDGAGSEFFTPLAPLEEIEYPPVASLFLGYKKEQVSHPLDGFGALVPELEKLPFLGVLFSSSLFIGRAPAGHVSLTVMIGGTRQPGLASLSAHELIDLVSPGLESLLGVKGQPVFHHLSSHAHAIPQYNMGYERHLELMDEFESEHPGLCIAGHVRDGIAVPACLASGETRAAQLLQG